jgi:cytochrome d ubiquinol oxidase subunit I
MLIVMSADPLLLARAQFGLNIGFHILFPSINIGSAGCCCT